MPSHRNAIDTVLTVNVDVQNASPTHVGSLLAMKSGAGFGRNEPMLHEVNSKGASRASGRRILCDAVIWRKHA